MYYYCCYSGGSIIWGHNINFWSLWTVVQHTSRYAKIYVPSATSSMVNVQGPLGSGT